MDKDNKIVDEFIKSNNVVSFEKMFKEKHGSGKSLNYGNIGNGNIIAGESVYINQPPTVNVVNVVPGSEHISDAQAYQIKELVAKIVELEAQVKTKPRSHSAVWSSFKKKFRCTKYQLLKASDFEEAISYLRQTIGRLSSTSAAKRSPDWRKRKYSYIHTNVKQLNIEQARKDYMAVNFGAESMKELSDNELEQLYRWVSKQK